MSDVRAMTSPFLAFRIVTWNCARGPFAKKRAAIEQLDPDIVVLSEAARPGGNDRGVHWFGDGSLGVAMYAREPWSIRPLRSSRKVPCVYPVAVEGPLSFTLFGVWTWPAPSYRAALFNGLVAHERIRGTRAFAGDFNGNVDFDKPRSRIKWSHCFERLASSGLVSAYHRDRPFGREPDPTHYFLWKQHRPFHLDYCFVPHSWTIERVTVGTFADWASLSDHRPVS